MASGSRGNASLIEAGGTTVLVDCGLPVRELEKRIVLVGKNPKKVEAVFLTHEHRDHLSGLVAFCHKYNALAFVHEKVFYKFSYLFEKIRDNVRVFSFSDFYFGSLTVSPFELCHDSVCCVGFAFYCGGKKVSFATDTGYLPDVALEAMQGSDIVFLESNHDQKMLLFGPYDARLKRRIASEEGHLSNADCAKAVVGLARGGTKSFVLCHLSQENNLPEIARNTVAEAAVDAGYQIELEVASQNNPTKIFVM